MARCTDFLSSCCHRNFWTIPLKLQRNQDWKHKLLVRGNNVADLSLSPDNSFLEETDPKQKWSLSRYDSTKLWQWQRLLCCSDCRRCLIMNNNTERRAKIERAAIGILLGGWGRGKKRSSDHFFKKTFLASRCFWSSLKFFLVIAIPPKESRHYCEMIWANR